MKGTYFIQRNALMPLDSSGVDRYLHYFLAPDIDLLEQVET